MRVMFLQLVLTAAFGIGADIQKAGTVQRSTSDHDRAVVLAVLEHTVRPGVARAHGRTTPVFPLYVFNLTAPICKDAPDGYPCAPLEEIDVLRNHLAAFDPPLEQVLASDTIRRELIESFKAINRNRQRLPRLLSRDVVMVSTREIFESRDKPQGPARGYSYLSRPAYSKDGYALLYASYTCGVLCGQSWLVVLQRTATGWQVAAVAMTALS
jgi:hypothetical protein